MTPFEYISVLLSVVISLALAHLLVGITKIIKTGVIRWSIPLMGWLGIMAFLCIDYWFSIWTVRDLPVWTLGFVSFLLLLGAVLFVSCWMLVPTIEGNDPIDLAAHYDVLRRKFLICILFYSVLAQFANPMLEGFESTTVQLIGITQIALIVTAWAFRSPIVQLGVVAAMCVLMVWYAFNFLPAL